MKSILNSEKECYVCKTTYNIHEHHVFYGSANRKKSEQDGMKVYLCAKHHNMSNEGVHFNKDLDRSIKQMAEQKWLDYYGKSIDDFIKRYGRNYL